MTGPTLAETDPTWLARAWREVDPNPNTRESVAAMLQAGGEPLERTFTARLHFGTAGIRGALGAGPGCMNRVLVRVIAAALGSRLLQATEAPHVVVGYDARHRSDTFAHDTARVLAARGIQVSVIDQPQPTPLLAFAVRHFGADAGVMVTASHNPRTDNGYKVYWRDGEPLHSPIDTEISALIDQTPLVGEHALAPFDHPAITPIHEQAIAAYLTEVQTLLRPTTSRTTRVAYTPLHGVGNDLMMRALSAAGFPEPAIVESEARPDPNFPGLPFPNPEEPGVLEPLITLGSEVAADVVFANDPDADRLAVAVPNRGRWQLLSGDEVGVLLADYLLRMRPLGDAGLFANTIVSSRLLEVLATEHGATFTRTPVGFKHIVHERHRSPQTPFVLGYEEALGYCIGDVVRDKDGIGAALVVAEMVSELAESGETLLDQLDAIHRRLGAHCTGQQTVRYGAESAVTPAQALNSLRTVPISALGGETVLQTTDLAASNDPFDALVFELDQARLVARPSGTEAKLKIYGETWAEPPTAPDQLDADRATCRRRLNRLVAGLGKILADPERRQSASAHSAGAIPADATASQTAAELFSQPLGSNTDAPLSRVEALRLLVRCIDLTTLSGDDTPGRIRALCAQARRPDAGDPTVGPTAAVCVYPSLIGLVAELNLGTSVRSAAVAGAFPSGLSDIAVKIADVQEAVAGGADEIDVVLNRSAFLAGDLATVRRELRRYRHAAANKTLKVILEVGELESPTAIREAAGLAMECGADFIKTSTGKGNGGATPTAVLVMAEAIAERVGDGGQPVGLKVSGGVRATDDALGYLSIVHATLGSDWITPDRLRFGASSLLTAVLDDLNTIEAAG